MNRPRGRSRGTRGRGPHNRNWPTENNAPGLRLESLPSRPYRGTSQRNRFQRESGREAAEMNFRLMGFKFLQSLLDKDMEEFILTLSNDRKGFSRLIECSNMSNDFVVLVIKTLKRVCDVPHSAIKSTLFHLVLKEPFLSTLVNFINGLPLQKEQEKKNSTYFWNEPDEFWKCLVLISKDLLKEIPTFATCTLPNILESLSVYIPVFEARHGKSVPADIKSDVETLHRAVEETLTEQKNNATLRKKEAMLEEVEEPPNDFREIAVYPSAAEVKGRQDFLRPNVVEGPYKNVNHYLDVQFRLLREDFVRPLRKAIESYLAPEQTRPQNVKIYKHIRFLCREVVDENFCIRVKFAFNEKGNVKIDFVNSKRFLQGSLLCFTANNFKTVFFGKVAKRDVKDLQVGEVIVGFSRDLGFSTDADYLMVECNVYFEPYYHVLQVLKSMSEENFPMEKYIVRVDSTPQPPKYSTRKPTLSLWTRLLNADDSSVHLNESQQVAFKAAISEEFVLIQGPPGTGKTFLGLHIAKTLLRNEEMWYDRSPMLVVCYTNHALDQFLEGISRYTDQIIRVGGRSKNENLRQFGLRAKNIHVDGAVLSKKLEVKRCANEIRLVIENLKFINSFTGVLNFHAFRDVVPDYEQTWFHNASKDEIIKWLFGGRESTNQEDVNTELDNAALAQDEDNEVLLEDKDNAVLAEEEDNAHNSDEEDDVLEAFRTRHIVSLSHYILLDIKQMRMKIISLEEQLYQISQQDADRPLEVLIQEQNIRCDLYDLRDDLQYLRVRLDQGTRNQNPTKPKRFDLIPHHDLLPDERWRLYFHWLHLYKERLQKTLLQLNNDFRKSYRVYEQMRDVADVGHMKNALVIGMTTTCAARLKNTLALLKCPIVIVEEAAEVLEAHIVAALTSDCRHLILIGDHQQLKPSTADFYIETKYRLGISLFERMVINKVNCYTLNVQHRMRPEISRLVRPTIYPFLQDHESVEFRPPILGVDKCLYFLDHEILEAPCEDFSKKNPHEATFLIYLARHLVLNGHNPENITILAAYLGQMFEMQRELKRHLDMLEHVKIAVLDNYQGEESDIILLSLVRSNKDNKIGFLKIDNRVCVALSRAKNGMYVMGNMTQLSQNSELWTQIRDILKDQDAIGTQLSLRCQIHTDTVTEVASAEDFFAISEGGCTQKCMSKLICGHNCTMLCHIRDRHHVQYKCRELCARPLCDTNASHLCQKNCYEDCGPCTYKIRRHLACDHEVDLECWVEVDSYQCVVLVVTKLPCGHVVNKPCHRDPQTFRCTFPCEIMVEPCGHACTLNCHVREDPDHLKYKCMKKCAKSMKDCTSTEPHLCPKRCYEECPPCEILVKKKRTVCPHVYNVPCSADVDESDCQKPCGKELSCGHKCKNMCGRPCGDCQINVTKKMPLCDHDVKLKCCETPDRNKCNKLCPLKLPCGHRCTTTCNLPCTTKCEVKVNCNRSGKCGHNITQIECYMQSSVVPCDDPNLLKCCTQPCQTKLECGHSCSGTCGECFQGRIHKRCQQKCGAVLICNHQCRYPCSEACRPCNLPCEQRCRHSRCSKPCGEPCTPCKEKCERRCPHKKCEALCGDMCSVPPCEERCEKFLTCRHKCIGFCGDPCPPKCVVCEPDEVLEIFFGTEEPNSVFVYLNDCRHIVESTGMEQWLQESRGVVGLKVCPKCKVPIKTTHRYSGYVKEAMKSVVEVKIKTVGTQSENGTIRRNLLVSISDLRSRTNVAGLISTMDVRKRIKKIEDTLISRLQRRTQDMRQTFNKFDLNAIKVRIEILDHLVSYVREKNNPLLLPQIKFILDILMQDVTCISQQEIEDIQRELKRLDRLVTYAKIKSSLNFIMRKSDAKITDLSANIENLMFSLRPFTEGDNENLTRLMRELLALIKSGLGITDDERTMILSAIKGVKRGAWFKCPKGHIYAIGDCGGAMVESTCPECGARIGGAQHRLLADNYLANEMDAARFPAWSETANMNNFDLNEI